MPDETQGQPGQGTAAPQVAQPAGREPSPAQATQGVAGQSGTTMPPELATWQGNKTYPDGERLWQGHRELQSEYSKTKNQVAQLERAMQERENQIAQLREQYEGTQKRMAPFQTMLDSLTGQRQQDLTEAQKGQLAEDFLADPQGCLEKWSQPLIQKALEQAGETRLKPLEAQIQSEQQRRVQEQTAQLVQNWSSQYGGEHCDAVAEAVKQEAEQGGYGPEWVELHKNPVVMDYRLKVDYIGNAYKALVDAVRTGDRQKIQTILTGQQTAPPDTRGTHSVGSESQLSAIEREMDEAAASGRR